MYPNHKDRSREQANGNGTRKRRRSPSVSRDDKFGDEQETLRNRENRNTDTAIDHLKMLSTLNIKIKKDSNTNLTKTFLDEFKKTKERWAYYKKVRRTNFFDVVGEKGRALAKIFNQVLNYYIKIGDIQQAQAVLQEARLDRIANDISYFSFINGVFKLTSGKRVTADTQRKNFFIVLAEFKNAINSLDQPYFHDKEDPAFPKITNVLIKYALIIGEPQEAQRILREAERKSNVTAINYFNLINGLRILSQKRRTSKAQQHDYFKLALQEIEILKRNYKEIVARKSPQPKENPNYKTFNEIFNVAIGFALDLGEVTQARVILSDAIELNIADEINLFTFIHRLHESSQKRGVSEAQRKHHFELALTELNHFNSKTDPKGKQQNEKIQQIYQEVLDWALELKDHEKIQQLLSEANRIGIADPRLHSRVAHAAHDLGLAHKDSKEQHDYYFSLVLAEFTSFNTLAEQPQYRITKQEKYKMFDFAIYSAIHLNNFITAQELLRTAEKMKIADAKFHHHLIHMAHQLGLAPKTSTEQQQYYFNLVLDEFVHLNTLIGQPGYQVVTEEMCKVFGVAIDCAIRLRRIEQAQAFLRQTEDLGYANDICWYTLINGLHGLGKNEASQEQRRNYFNIALNEAAKFDSLKNKPEDNDAKAVKAKIFSVGIDCALRIGKVEDAQTLLRTAEKTGNTIAGCYGSIIHGLHQLGLNSKISKEKKHHYLTTALSEFVQFNTLSSQLIYPATKKEKVKIFGAAIDCAIRLGRVDKAQELLQETERSDHASAECNFILIHGLYTLGRASGIFKEQKKNYFQLVLKQFENFKMLLDKPGYYRLRAERQLPEIFDIAIACSIRLGKYTEARTLIREAEKLKVAGPRMYDNLIYKFWKLASDEKASQELQDTYLKAAFEEFQHAKNWAHHIQPGCQIEAGGRSEYFYKIYLNILQICVKSKQWENGKTILEELIQEVRTGWMILPKGPRLAAEFQDNNVNLDSIDPIIACFILKDFIEKHLKSTNVSTINITYNNNYAHDTLKSVLQDLNLPLSQLKQDNSSPGKWVYQLPAKVARLAAADFSRTLNPSLPGDSHLLKQNRASENMAAVVDVVTHRY